MPQEVVAGALSGDLLERVGGFLEVEEREFLRHPAFERDGGAIEGGPGAFEQDDGARVAILRGGDAAFSGGEDDAVCTTDPDLVQRQFWYPLLDEPPSSEAVWATLFARRTVKPVVAAVNGACLGAGLVLMALHSDLRVAGRGASFGKGATYAFYRIRRPDGGVWRMIVKALQLPETTDKGNVKITITPGK